MRRRPLSEYGVTPGRRLNVAAASGVWDKRRNPTKHVSDVLQIARWQLRGAIHRIKARSNLGGQDRIIIHSDGSVKDSGGAEIGNIFDEL